MPAAIDPDRYRATRGWHVVSRLAGVVFFMGSSRPTACSDFFDLVFLVPEAVLLFIATRGEPPSSKATAAER